MVKPLASSATKKRKSSTGDGTANSNIRLKVVVEKPDPLKDPIVVSFPGGMPEALQQGYDNTDAQIPKFLWQKRGSPSHKSNNSRRVVGADHKCLYTGSSDGIDYDNRRSKLCVGIYNKKTGTLTLRPAASKGTVYALRQTVLSYESKLESSEGTSKIEQYQNLFSAFGSAKKKKAIKSTEANRVDIKNVVGAGKDSVMVQKFLKGEGMSESNQKSIAGLTDRSNPTLDPVERAHAEARRNFLPKYNEEAEEPHLVYDASDMAGEHLWYWLDRIVRSKLNNDNQTSISEALSQGISRELQNDSFMDVISKIKGTTSASIDQYKCALLLNDFLNFYNIMKLKRKIYNPDFGRPIWLGLSSKAAMRCFEQFATKSDIETGKVYYTMTKPDADRLMIHILILYVMCGGRLMKSGNLKLVCADMKITPSTAVKLLRLAGFTITSSGAGTIVGVSLKVPLQFPPPPKRQGMTKR